MKWITNIEWDGSELEVHCTYEPAEDATRDHPGTDISVDVTKVMMILPDKNDNMVLVNIIDTICMDIDYDTIIETIIEDIKNDEPDPDRDRL